MKTIIGKDGKLREQFFGYYSDQYPEKYPVFAAILKSGHFFRENGGVIQTITPEGKKSIHYECIICGAIINPSIISNENRENIFYQRSIDVPMCPQLSSKAKLMELNLNKHIELFEEKLDEDYHRIRRMSERSPNLWNVHTWINHTIFKNFNGLFKIEANLSETNSYI